MAGAGGKLAVTDRPRALIVLIVVFLLGGIIGSAGSYIWFRKAPGPKGRMMQEFPPEFAQGRHGFGDLKLAPEQERQFREITAESHRKIQEVIARHQPQFEAIISKQQPEIEAIVFETNRKLMSILNEDQKKIFESFLKEMENWRMGPPHGGRRMDPPSQFR